MNSNADIHERINQMEEKLNEHTLAFELLTSLKQANKRFFAVVMLLIAVLVASNFYWLYTFTQYDFVSYDLQADSGDGGGPAINNFIGGEGDITNGESTIVSPDKN